MGWDKYYGWGIVDAYNALSGVSDVPDIAVTPTSYDYGNVNVGEYKDNTFVVKNEGAATLSVSSTTLIGADASEFSIQSGGGSFDLNPGATRNVVVRFEPDSEGSKNATLRFASNDPDENPFDVTLTGIGTESLLKWKFKTGERVNSSPAIGSDSTIYVGSFDYYLYAINPNGTQKWKFKTGGVLYYSSPAIGSDGTIYVGSDDYYFYAINSNGIEKWKFKTGSYVRSYPAIGSDGTIYVWSEDYYLYAINPDGTEKWKFQTGGGASSIGSDGTIYVGSRDNYLYAINPDGTEKWKFQTGDDVDSCPAIGSDGTIYVGSFDGCIYAINPNGTQKWKFKTGDIADSSPAIGSDGTIYVGSYYYLYAINPNGTEKWKFQAGDAVYSSPAIGSDGTIYVGSRDSYLYALNSDSMGLADSHWPKFRHDNQNTGRVPPDAPDIAVTPPSYDYGNVYVGEHEDKTFVVKNEGTAMLSVSSTTLIGANPSDFSEEESSFDLNPGETKNVVVRFEPESEGSKNATLRFVSNDPDENPYDVTLMGKGAIAPTKGDVITLDNAECMPGDEVRIPLYIRDVSGTPLDADDAINKIAAWTIQFSADNEYYQITGVERAGITAGLKPYLEQFHDGNNTWTVIYNTSAGNPPPAFTLDKPAPGDLIGQLVVKIADTEVDEDTPVPVEIMSTTTMLSNEGGTVGESVSEGTLRLVGGTLTIISFICGDTNGNRVGPDFLDVVYLLNYVVGGGPPPDPLRAGNVNGIGGVDFLDVVYLLNFVVGGGPEPVCSDVTTVVASVESQTKDVLTLGEINANAGETIRLPLYLQDVSGTPLDADDAGNEVAAWTIRFSADNENYQITGVERAGITAGLKPYLEQFHDGNNTWTVIYNTSAGNPPPTFTLDKPAPGDLIGELVITLSDKAEGDLLVEISDATLSNEAGTVGEKLVDGTLGVVAGTIHVENPLYGDVTGDGSVTALDAAVVLQACVGLVTLTPEQEKRADVSGENGVTAYDASLILRYVVGLIEKFPVEGDLATPANNGQNYTLSVGKVSARANERIVVPINIDDAKGILSGKISLTYDSAYLNPIGVRVRNQVFGKNSVSQYNVRDGVLEFSFANSEELRDEVGQDGNHPLLFVEFEARNISTRTIPLTLSESYLNEGLNTRKVDGWVKFIPETNALLNNFPNPFNPDTWIPYQLKESASVVIRIYNVSGQLVRVLDIGHRQAGFYVDKVNAAYWDGCDKLGERVASGVYFYQLEAGKYSAVRKMTIIK